MKKFNDGIYKVSFSLDYDLKYSVLVSLENGESKVLKLLYDNDNDWNNIYTPGASYGSINDLNSDKNYKIKYLGKIDDYPEYFV